MPLPPDDRRPTPFLPSRVRRVLLHRQVTGRFPPLLRPRTFSEKLTWRVCFDRRALLAPTCDKRAMKEHARRRAPGLVRVPRTLWAGTDVAELAGVDLPEHWVLKPNHSCRRVLVGTGPADPADLAVRTAGWVAERYADLNEEWAYRRARPGLLVEEFVGVPGRVPVDLKVLVFDGVPRLVEQHTGRGSDHRMRLLTPDWEPLPWTAGYRPGPPTPPPEGLADLVAAAAALGAGFDMLRVDLYEHGGQLWFGELTPYPGAGWTPMEPELDALLGSWWTLPGRRPRPQAPAVPPAGEERAAA
ncbi:ATP-grasp fold amidoligase family protein [Geodermatophilus sp. SYSU D00758]